jgi:serpin B
MTRLPLLAVLAAGCGQTPAVPPTAEGKAIAEANNRFALAFFAEHRKTPGSLFVSPLSLHAALGMTAAGAGGQTLAEMRRVLHLPADPAAADAGFANLLAAATGDRPGYRLRTANAVWGQAGYPWKPTFATRLKAGFGAGVREANFTEQPDAERLRVNAWAEEQTNGKIKDLLPEGSIDRLVRMVLANAIHFKGEWAERFDPKWTKPAPFSRADGSKADVPMMSHEGGFRLFTEHTAGQWEPNLWVAELPYRGNEAAMVLIVPGKHDGLPALEARLTPEALAGWLTAAKPCTDAHLSLPKFKLETVYRESAGATGPLHAIGMSSVFDKSQADLTAMHAGPEQLHASLLVHKAFVEVNEEGTEAAAATAVIAKGDSGSLSYHADRPFLFLIRHVPTGAILFLGRYAGPTP